MFKRDVTADHGSCDRRGETQEAEGEPQSGEGKTARRQINKENSRAGGQKSLTRKRP